MEILTVRTDQMRPWIYVTIELVTQIRSLHVKMEDVFRNCGFAILTMIVVMTQMNQLICADRETVPQVLY